MTKGVLRSRLVGPIESVCSKGSSFPSRRGCGWQPTLRSVDRSQVHVNRLCDNVFHPVLNSPQFGADNLPYVR